MDIEDAPILVERRALQIVGLAGLKPMLAGLRNGDAVDADGRMVGIGRLLLRERLDVALALLVDVIDDPG